MKEHLSALLDYAYERGMITEYDESYAVNKILALIGGDDFEKVEHREFANIDEILAGLLDFANENGKLEDNTVTYRDILSAEIMDNFTPRPGELIRNFNKKYESSPVEATDYFYALSQDNNYIMTERIKKNIIWKTMTKYGEIDITINLSKPEKDPKEIAKAKTMKQTGYPKCLLCKENVGIKGHANHPARTNHRIIPMNLAGEEWFFQYSPYVYYNEHCIALSGEHTPMKIERKTFQRLLDFVTFLPHYFIGSNSDLPIVGGSILTHNHFQGGNYEFTMAQQPIKKSFVFKGYEDVEAGIVDWALSTIRMISDDKEKLCDLGEKILNVWREYSDEENDILAYTDQLHNTVTSIARKRNGKYELDLILRNNRTSEEHPDGIFHAHSEYHHIKKEGIGLIEAMGLAVLPPRLLEQFPDMDDAKREEIGQIFANILENCGVFKDTEKGNAGFVRFMEAVNAK